MNEMCATVLDASKAFDTVKCDTLFEFLLAKHVCPTIARLLSFLTQVNYVNKVMWGHYHQCSV